MRALPAALLGLGWLASGCGPPADCEPSLAIGTGIDLFEPLHDGDELELVFGPQGGYHLPLAVEGCGLGGDAWLVDIEAVELSEEVTVSSVRTQRLPVPEDRCCDVITDLVGFVSVPGVWDAGPWLDGRNLEVRVRVEDARGRVVKARLGVIAVWDPGTR